MLLNKNNLIATYESLPHTEDIKIREFSVKQWFEIKYYNSKYNEEIKLLAKLIDQSVPPIFEIEILNETFIVFEPWVNEKCSGKSDLDALTLFKERYNEEYVNYYYGELYLKHYQNRNVTIEQLDAGENNYFNLVFLFLLINLVNSLEISRMGDNTVTDIKVQIVNDCTRVLESYSGNTTSMVNINNNYNGKFVGEYFYACHYETGTRIVSIKNPKFKNILNQDDYTIVKASINLNKYAISIPNKFLSVVTPYKVDVTKKTKEMMDVWLSFMNPAYANTYTQIIWGLAGGGAYSAASVAFGLGTGVGPFLMGFGAAFNVAGSLYSNTHAFELNSDLLKKHDEAYNEFKTYFLPKDKTVIWIEDYMLKLSTKANLERSSFNSSSIDDAYRIKYDTFYYYEQYGYVSPVIILLNWWYLNRKRGSVWNYNTMSKTYKNNIIEENLLYDFVNTLQNKTIKEIKEDKIKRSYESLVLFDSIVPHSDLNWEWNEVEYTKETFEATLKPIIKKMFNIDNKDDICKKLKDNHVVNIKKYNVNVNTLVNDNEPIKIMKVKN
jgi:hypothetical protein